MPVLVLRWSRFLNDSPIFGFRKAFLISVFVYAVLKKVFKVSYSNLSQSFQQSVSQSKKYLMYTEKLI